MLRRGFASGGGENSKKVVEELRRQLEFTEVYGRSVCRSITRISSRFDSLPYSYNSGTVSIC